MRVQCRHTHTRMSMFNADGYFPLSSFSHTRCVCKHLLLLLYTSFYRHLLWMVFFTRWNFFFVFVSYSHSSPMSFICRHCLSRSHSPTLTLSFFFLIYTTLYSFLKWMSSVAMFSLYLTQFSVLNDLFFFVFSPGNKTRSFSIRS